MRIAFYAPLKAPTHEVASGDRHMARLLMDVLRRAGHEVELASRFRAWDGRGDSARQRRLEQVAQRLAERLLRRYRARPPVLRPGLWFTYHLYHKAPDWFGPRMSRALGIPYVVAEASFAPKQAGGRWALGHRAAEQAIRHADGVIALNGADVPCVRPLLKGSARLLRLEPFLDASRYRPADDRSAARAELARRHGLDPTAPWLLAVAMMRVGDKLASYRILSEALNQITECDWQLVVVGDGAARPEVEDSFRALGAGRVQFTGKRTPGEIAELCATADLFVWPAINEAYGMALLEAQASGLPVVAGRSGGVPAIVGDGESGRLTPAGDARAFADAVAELLDDQPRRRAMGEAARRKIPAEHDIASAVSAVGDLIDRVKGAVVE